MTRSDRNDGATYADAGTREGAMDLIRRGLLKPGDSCSFTENGFYCVADVTKEGTLRVAAKTK